MTRWLPKNTGHLNERLPERIQLMKDTGMWERIDFRFPEGLKQKEYDYMRQAWEGLTESDIRRLAEKYNISYVIREQSLPLDLPTAKILKKQELVIYDVSAMPPEETTEATGP